MTNKPIIEDIIFGKGQLIISDGCRIPVLCNLVGRNKIEIQLKIRFGKINFPAIFDLVNRRHEILKLEDGKLFIVCGMANGYDDCEKTLLISGKEIIPM